MGVGEEVGVGVGEEVGVGVGEVTMSCTAYATEVPIIPLSVRGNTVTLKRPPYKTSNITGDKSSLVSLVTTFKLPAAYCNITEYPNTTELSKLHDTTELSKLHETSKLLSCTW